jgi:hypothetical protein
MKNYTIEEIINPDEKNSVVLICSDGTQRIFGFKKYEWNDTSQIYGKQIGDRFDESWLIYASLTPITGVYNDIKDIKRNIFAG